ncbi:putative protein kinase TKL-Pl-5 family [Helianthus annuus]|nr:putative protein kinase TKL-Pl-5 family [Helianthus annuus]
MAYETCDDFDMQRIGNFLSCASRGDRVGLNLMLRDGISPNVQDYDKRTALHLAASEGHASIVELLLHYKADVNLDDRWNRTPLTDARLYGHRDICRILEVNGGKDSVMNSPMTVVRDEDAKEVNIDISEIDSVNSEPIEQVFSMNSGLVLSANDNTQLRELRHPNILQFLGSIMHEGQMILITEHLPRGRLYDMLIQRAGLDLPLALRFALDIARSLDCIDRGMNYLHHHKPYPIIHNNLDPKNLLQDEGGHLKIGEYWIQMLYELHPNQERMIRLLFYLLSSYVKFPCPVNHFVFSGTVNRHLVNKGRDVLLFGLILYQVT